MGEIQTCFRRIKTTNMGTLYELTYDIVLKNERESKLFLDALRCRNGNLPIICGKPVTKDALYDEDIVLEDAA